VNVIGSVFQWLGDPAHWSGEGGVPNRVLEHLTYTGAAVGLGVLVAVPLGALIGHYGRGGVLVGLVNALRAIPELGLLIILELLMGVGLLPVTLALVVLAVPPLLAGTYAGVSTVDRAVVDAARGMGMRDGAVLWRVELPIALPLILGGLRAATLQVIATATIAAFVSYGGLGRYVVDGQRSGLYVQMAAGALLIAALALAVEGLLALVQRLAVSPGLSSSQRRARVVARPVTSVIDTSGGNTG
jgi:osmoprotectant transport system permease protein